MAKAKSAASESVTLSQQGVNLIRQITNAIGWAKSVEDVAIGGELVAHVFPVLDDASAWAKTDAEVKKMTPDDAKAYLEKDRAWSVKPYTFAVTEKQRAVVAKAFKHFVEESAKAGKLGPNKWLSELISVFGISGDDDKAIEQR